MAAYDDTITLTFGDYDYNRAIGLSFEDLVASSRTLEAEGKKVTIFDLRGALPQELQDQVEPAYLFLARCDNFLTLEQADNLYEEVRQLPFDTKYYDTQRQKVLNKRSRYNICIADYSQEGDCEKGIATVVDFQDLTYVRKLRKRIQTIFGSKAKDLICETNLYYDPKKCGIGFHGDTERRVAVCVRLGATMPLHFQWYFQGQPIGKRIRITLNHGDIYAMSNKTVGHDYRKWDVLTLRHAAGADKYLK